MTDYLQNGSINSGTHGLVHRHATPFSTAKEEEGENENDVLLPTDTHNIQNGKEEEFVNLGRERIVSAPQTLLNLMKVYLGSGILGLPYAFKQGGFFASMVVMTVVAALTTHSMYLLVQCKKQAVREQPKIVTFTDIARYTYGWIGAWLVNFFLVFTQYGFTCVYVVFLSQNTENFVPDDIHGWWVHWRIFALFWIPPLCVLANIPTLKHLSFIAVIADVCILSGIGVILVAACWNMYDKIEAHESMDVQWWFAPKTFAVMFGMAIYAFEGIGVVIPAETAMRHPEKFTKVLMTTMVVSSFNYIVFGAVCYLGFGQSTHSLVTVDLHNFSDSHVWRVLSTLVTIALIIAITATYPIQLFVVTDICEEAMFKSGWVSTRFKILKQILFRCALVCGSAGIAVAIPNFGLLIGLIGAMGSAALQFTFPALFHLKLFPGDPLWLKAISVFYILFGIGGGILGTVQTVMEIVDDYS